MTISYIFGDLKTGRIFEEIPMFSVSLMDELNTDGEFRGSIQMDMSGKNNEDLVAATIPGRCFLVCEINSVPIWGGIVWSRTYQATAKTLQLYCRGFEAYANKRFVREPFDMTAEQSEIFLALWNEMQSKPDGNLLVEVPPSVATGIIKTIRTEPSNFKSYGTFMAQLSDSVDGFDWKIRVVRDRGVYRRKLQIGYPFLGAPATDDSIVLEFPGAITNYWETDSIGDSGTNIYVSGAGEGTTMLTTEVIHEQLLTTGWLRFDVESNHKDITDPNILNTIGEQEAKIRKAPAAVLKTEIKTNIDPVFGSYSLGDFMNVVIKDPRHPKTDVMSKRVIRWEFWPPEQENVGQAILTFESFEDLPS